MRRLSRGDAQSIEASSHLPSLCAVLEALLHNALRSGATVGVPAT